MGSNDSVNGESIKMNFTHENSDKFKAFPRKRQDVLLWKGWGYKDCQFEVGDDLVVGFKGDRYPALANVTLPRLGPWFEDRCDVDLDLRSRELFEILNVNSDCRENLNVNDYPDPIRNEEFILSVEGIGIASFDTRPNHTWTWSNYL